MTPFSASEPVVPQTVIPVLTHSVQPDNLSASVLAALDRQHAEKAALFALAGKLQDSLKPELERLTQELVQKTLQTAWQQRASDVSDPI